MIIFDATSRELDDRKANWEKHLAKAFEVGTRLV
jgi:hypothetical protein